MASPDLPSSESGALPSFWDGVLEQRILSTPREPDLGVSDLSPRLARLSRFEDGKLQAICRAVCAPRVVSPGGGLDVKRMGLAPGGRLPVRRKTPVGSVQAET